MVKLAQVLTILAIFISVSLSSTSTRAEDSDVLFPMGEAPAAAPVPAAEKEGMSVSLHKIKAKKSEPKPVELVSPKPDAEFTPGVITFYWRIRSDFKKNKIACVLENLDNGKKATRDARGEQMDFDLKPGKYRWQVISKDSSAKSSWRTFEVTKLDYSSGLAGNDLKNVSSDVKVEDLASQHEAIKISRADDPTARHTTKAEEDRKLAEYKQKKISAEQQANDLEKRIKTAEMDARRALQVAKEEQLHLKQVRQEKIRADRLAQLRLAKLEADRKAKIKLEQQARERIAKQRTKQLIAVKVAKVKLQEATKKYRTKLKETEIAKMEAERASNDLSLKIAAVKQIEAPPQSMPDESQIRSPANIEDNDLPQEVEGPKAPEPRKTSQVERAAPQQAAPQTFLRSSGDDLQWSDSK